MDENVTAAIVAVALFVDAIALEVERISEAQRFATKLLGEHKDTASRPLQSRSSTDTPT